jgi:hypothetical protein
MWHLLFECDRTRDHAVVARIKQRARAMVIRICDLVLEARNYNQLQMNNIADTGYVDNIDAAVSDVRRIAQNYYWECTPGRWLIYVILLGLPFSKSVVRPPAAGYINPTPTPKPRTAAQQAALRVRVRQPRRPPITDVDPVLALPQLTDAQFSLPEAFGALMDTTTLPNNALRPLSTTWIRRCYNHILALGGVVSPM